MTRNNTLDQQDRNGVSVFDAKTDASSSDNYFHYYGKLAQQQNMLQDYVRTGTYQQAMLKNYKEFEGKIVVDVGTGTGMLSFFALQAGAKKVYAIEASNMAIYAKKLAENNGLGDRLIIVKGKVEEVSIPEPVDIIISEPMGILLVNERMLESYIYARKWLKPGGNMYPTTSTIYFTPFQDDMLYCEFSNKASFWTQQSFYGVDLRSCYQSALDECFESPVVDRCNPGHLLSRPKDWKVDFLSCIESDLAKIEIPFEFKLSRPATVHGLCFWFDVSFLGTQETVILSTAPYSPLTHWYQVRCMTKVPVNVKANQALTGKVIMSINSKQSYDIEMELGIEGVCRTTNVINLKEPIYRGSDPNPNDAGYYQDYPSLTTEHYQ